MRIFNVGWIVFTMMIAVLGFTIYGAFTNTGSVLSTLKASGGVFAFLGIGYVGAVIGNAIRLYAMPDMYFTDGTLWGAFKTRFFWSHGPQLSGFFLIYIVIMRVFAAS
jgi:hypothetical protein